ncbi:MAG: cysteine desulfurase family protein [Candidatus Hodarchaeales archaeon]|jgi:cysteine desulfurase
MKVYLDNLSSTRVDKEVIDSMLPFYNDIISPPSSDYGHSFGVEAKEALDTARKSVSTKLNAGMNEIVFTSGQAESNNFAVKGTALANLNKPNNFIIVSGISHSTILDSVKYLKRVFDFKIENLKVDSEGFIDREHLKSLLEKKPLLVSIPHGNVEIGTIENIKEIATICHGFDVPIHVDATYSFCKVPIDVKDANIDLLTIEGHHIHGPKGVGALFIKKGFKIHQLIDGGLQENKKRGGTENLPGIVGFGKAIEKFTPDVIKKNRKLRDYLWNKFEQKIPNFQITGPSNKDNRLPNHFSVVIHFVEGESILLHLDMLGFMIATGSACSSKQLKASHVLSAIGLPTEVSHGSVRVGVSKYNTEEEIDHFVENLSKVVERLRAMSPMDTEFMREWQEMKDKGEIPEEDLHHH